MALTRSNVGTAVRSWCYKKLYIERVTGRISRGCVAEYQLLGRFEVRGGMREGISVANEWVTPYETGVPLRGTPVS